MGRREARPRRPPRWTRFGASVDLDGGGRLAIGSYVSGPVPALSAG
jgi:hypothetical protein